MRRPPALLSAALVLAVGGLAVAALPAARAVAAPAQENCTQPSTPDQMTPWAQQMLGADRAWPLSRGSGERVAVLDSGVDGLQPLLAGRVEPGFDATAGGGAANTDCIGTGTQVAGVIVAQQLGNSGLVGIAPDARVVPVRIISGSGSLNQVVDPGVLARGIDWAVGQNVAVICVSLAIYTDDPRVSDAVQRAEQANIPIVAAVGDKGGANDTNPKPYPAAYPGVIGVGAIDQNGARISNAGHGSFVDLVAPGGAVLTTQRVTGTTAATGTGPAAGFVAGTVALVKRRWSFSTSQVLTQLRATATPAGAGPRSPELGAGVVNPYGAVAELFQGGSPAALPALTPHVLSPAEQAHADAVARGRTIATVLTLTALAVVVVILVAAVAIPRGRRRDWRPRLAGPPPVRPEPDEAAPPVMLFEQ